MVTNHAIMKTAALIITLISLLSLGSCKGQVSEKEKEQAAQQGSTTVKTAIGNLTLPPPYLTESATKSSSMKDWEGNTPKAPAGFVVTKFADGLKNPRNT